MRDALRRGMGDITYSQVRDNFEQRQSPPESFNARPARSTTPGGSSRPASHCRGELATIKHMQQGQYHSRADHARRRRRRPRPHRGSVPESGAAKGHRGGAHLAATGYRACRGWRAAAKPRPLRPSAKARSENGYAVEGFAPTSRAASQLRDAGIQADTLQGFLARGGVERKRRRPEARHLYMLDESSLASTRQMQIVSRKDWAAGPGFARLATPGSIRASMPESPSSRCRRPECGPRSLTRSCARKIPELLRAVEHLSQE